MWDWRAGLVRLAKGVSTLFHSKSDDLAQDNAPRPAIRSESEEAEEEEEEEEEESPFHPGS